MEHPGEPIGAHGGAEPSYLYGWSLPDRGER